MKMLMLSWFWDYTASKFEELFSPIDAVIVNGLWLEKDGDYTEKVFDYYGEEFKAYLTLREFPHVPDEFLTFMFSEVQDYEDSKHKWFYVIK